MSHPIDLDAYLRRVGIAGPTGTLRPDRETLQRLVTAHTAAIPFENLNPFLGLPVRLAPAELQRKLVESGRGGYCFEQNRLFAAVLSAIGFRVGGWAARVLWTQPDDALTPRSHLLLHVDGVDDLPLVVDVGFGGLTLTGTLRLIEGPEQRTPHEPFRLHRDPPSAGGDWRLQAAVDGAWRTLYRFDERTQHPIDDEAANYQLSHDPASRFVAHLVAARVQPGRRLALFDRDFAVHPLGGPSERRRIGSPDELRALLQDAFGITLPAEPALSERLDRRLQALFDAPDNADAA